MLKQEKLLVIPDNYLNLAAIIVLLILLMVICVLVYIITIELNKQKNYELISLKDEMIRKKETKTYKRRHNNIFMEKEKKEYVDG